MPKALSYCSVYLFCLHAAFHEAINASLLAFDISSTIDNLVMLNETLTMNEVSN